MRLESQDSAASTGPVGDGIMFDMDMGITESVAPIGLGFSRAVRAAMELASEGAADESVLRDRVDATESALDEWTSLVERATAFIGRQLETIDGEELIRAGIRAGGNDRLAALAQAREMLATSTAGAEMVANAIAFIDSLPPVMTVTLPAGPRVVTLEELRTHFARARAALVRAHETLDDAIDVGLVLTARLDPENDGPAVSLDELESSLRSAQ